MRLWNTRLAARRCRRPSEKLAAVINRHAAIIMLTRPNRSGKKRGCILYFRLGFLTQNCISTDFVLRYASSKL